MTICNRRKFLAFEEDTRPPYTGSWSKRSTKVTGRRPFGKDAALDYEYDSEAEWDEEEGGEDIDGNGMEDDDGEEEREKEKNANYDYGDNWMADDDDLGLSDDDDDARELRKQANKTEQADQVEKVVISCLFGGIPALTSASANVNVKACKVLVLNGEKAHIHLSVLKQKVGRRGENKKDRKEKQNSRRAWPVCALSYIIRQSAANGTGKHCFRRSPPDRC